MLDLTKGSNVWVPLLCLVHLTVSKPIRNDSQPEELVDKLFEAIHAKINSQPDELILSSGD